MLSMRIHQASMEAGERWMLSDVAGKSLYGWDSRDHRFRIAYDPLRRPTDSFLREGAGAEVIIGRTVYGETRPSPEASNLRGKVIQVFDQVGVATMDQYDFKGNLVVNQRRLAKVYSTTLDWSGAVPLEDATYTGRMRFDALNRPIQVIAPHSDQAGATVNVIEPIYNEASLLEQIHAWLNQNAEPAGWLDPNTADLHAVTNIDYNAKGQRERIDCGNFASTTYAYDAQTFRLARLETTRAADNAVLQDLNYTYDPIGNITHVRDDAQQTIYFRNKRVEPSADYTYDAIYRLIEATGREYLGQVGGAPIPHSYNDAARRGVDWAANDGNALGTYFERYVYDLAGNFREMKHVGTDPANPGWTRRYSYNEASLLEPAKASNRLSSTTVGNGNPVTEQYNYDAHGNLLGMPHLQVLQWDFKDQLQMTRRQAVNPGDADGVQHQGERTYYVYDSAGQRVRKVTELPSGQVKEERIYLGNFEIYRKNGANPLVRETLHLTDDKQRIALVETRTLGDDPAPRQLIRYQFGNHLDSAILELDDQAQIISYEEYSPYGSTTYQAVRSQTETPKRYRYTGKERDDATGLYYCLMRYYCPWLGIWISADPKGIDGGLNLYGYANQSPVVLRDPNGRDPQERKKGDEPAAKENKKGDKTAEKQEKKKESLQDQLDNTKEPEKKEEKKPPQPPIQNAGPTQTAGLPNDVGEGTLLTEINAIVLLQTPQDKDVGYTFQITPIQIHVRGRTSADTEQGVLLNYGGVAPKGGQQVVYAHPGSSFQTGAALYTLHTGTLVDPNSKVVQRARGHFLYLGLVFNNPSPATPVNPTGTYVYGASRVGPKGESGVDVNLGASVQAAGQVNGRTVGLFASPYVAVNGYFPGPDDTQINLEAYGGGNFGLAGVSGSTQAGDPTVPASLRVGGGVGIQKQVGKKGDNTVGFEILINAEPKANIAGPPGLTLPPISVGGVFTISGY
jgi:RHS repeat-associated protein